MSNETPAAARKRQMTLAFNVPAYVTIDVPDEIGDSKEALVEYAQQQMEQWWDDEDNIVFEPEWGNAIRETERIVTVSELDERGYTKSLSFEDISLDPPPASFAPVAGAENACRDGLVVEAYLIASTAHLTPSERESLEEGKSGNPHIIISAICECGWILHLNEQLVSGEIAPDQALANLSEGFAAVVRKALVYGLPYVRFDSDGPVIEGLPEYPDEPA